MTIITHDLIDGLNKMFRIYHNHLLEKLARKKKIRVNKKKLNHHIEFNQMILLNI